MVKRDDFYFSDVDYNFVLATKDLKGLEDGVLVHCQQMIEKLLKGLIKEKTGENSRIHSLFKLMKEYDKSVKSYNELLMFLTNCYYDRKYSTDEYIVLDRDEFEDFVKQSLELREYLLSRRTHIDNLNSFKK